MAVRTTCAVISTLAFPEFFFQVLEYCIPVSPSKVVFQAAQRDAHNVAVVELCAFKWIKQHLRIKAFYGISENAVKTQNWIAVSVYVLVAVVRKRLALEVSLYQILQILSVTFFEKTPILQALQPADSQEDLLASANQMT
jgi:hypothetical protein